MMLYESSNYKSATQQTLINVYLGSSYMIFMGFGASYVLICAVCKVGCVLKVHLVLKVAALMIY